MPVCRVRAHCRRLTQSRWVTAVRAGRWHTAHFVSKFSTALLDGMASVALNGLVIEDCSVW